VSLNLLEPILEESVSESTQDELVHYVCLECNGGVTLPLMECYCGHWDGSIDVEGDTGFPVCQACEELKEPGKCPKGHYY